MKGGWQAADIPARPGFASESGEVFYKKLSKPGCIGIVWPDS
jgi:hypothetical protein